MKEMKEMTYFDKVWNWIGISFIVFGVLGIVASVILCGFKQHRHLAGCIFVAFFILFASGSMFQYWAHKLSDEESAVVEQ